MSEKLLVPVQEAAELLSMGKSTFWQNVKKGNLPQPIKIGGLSRWRVEEILAVKNATAPVIPPAPVERPKFVSRPKGHHLYRHFDAAGTLLYVGISLNALNRLVAHIEDSAWYWSIATVTIDNYPTREDAEAAERLAICTERPLFNYMHGDKARRVLAMAML